MEGSKRGLGQEPERSSHAESAVRPAGRRPDVAAARAGESEPGSAARLRALGDRDREAGGVARQAAGAALDLEPFLWHL
jgi:hypothetical protein